MRILDTLYAKYVSERTNGKIIETDNGFVVYRINGPECFIMEFYISPDYRKSGQARLLVNQLELIARDHKCSHITGNIFRDTNGHKDTVIAALLIGFEIVSANSDGFTIAKNVMEEK